VNSFFKKVEVAANIAVIILAAVVIVVLIHRWTAGQQTPQVRNTPSQVDISKLPSLGIDWSKSERTLLLALSKDCHFCTESAAFYQRLAKDRNNSSGSRLIAVFPQPITDGAKYLEGLGVTVDEIKQYSTRGAVTSATPTLIMVGRTGDVLGIWTGKLTADKETEVEHRMRCGTEAKCA
jgi:hypothetical protein